MEIEWILIIHNNCIFPYYGYNIEIVWIYYGFSGAIANFVVHMDFTFFPSDILYFTCAIVLFIFYDVFRSTTSKEIESRNYYNIAHELKEDVKQQPNILVGGTLKEYQVRMDSLVKLI